MRINIPYSTSGLDFEIPDENIWQILFPHLNKPIEKFDISMMECLGNPISSPSLAEIIGSKNIQPKDLTVNIICDNINYQTPQREILDVLIPYLQNYGISQSNISILIASGNDRPMERDEIFERFGEWMSPILIENHSPGDEDNLIDVGKSPFGGRITLNKTAVKADLKIAIGSVSPDPLSGFTGGSMLVLPGIAGNSTIKKYHSLFINDDISRSNLIDNSFRILSNKAAMLLGLDFSINVVVNSSDSVCGLFCGHYLISFSRAAEFAIENMSVRVRPGSDLVIAGSYPADLDFFQSTKTFLNISKVLRDRGMMIFVSPCFEGVSRSHQNFSDYISTASDKLKNSIQSELIEDASAAAIAYHFSKELRRIGISLVTDGIGADEIQKMRIRQFNNINDAIDFCREKMGDGMRITIIPYGGKVIPYFEEEGENQFSTRWL